MKVQPVEIIIGIVTIVFAAWACRELYHLRPVELPATTTEAVSADTTAAPVYVEKRDTAVEALAYLMFEGVPTAVLKQFAVKPAKYGYDGGQFLVRGYARVELSCRLGRGYVVDIPKRGE